MEENRTNEGASYTGIYTEAFMAGILKGLGNTDDPMEVQEAKRDAVLIRMLQGD